jgi:hypothetical protein
LLHLHLLAHPESTAARQLSVDLMQRFVTPPVSGGLRIPVFLTPLDGGTLPPPLGGEDGLSLDAADHSLVVIMGNQRMVQTIRDGSGRAWIEFAARLRDLTPLDESPHHLLVIALDSSAYQLSSEELALSVFLDPAVDPAVAARQQLTLVSFHVAARALQLLQQGKVAASAPNAMKAPVRLFVSHAKDDLDPQREADPVSQTRAALGELPVEAWYDSQQIASSQKFSAAIQAGIRDASIVLAFQTDHFSERPWCRREVLDAKRMGAHVLLVNAVRSGEARSFPYGGNVPTIRWQYIEPAADARNVIDRAVLEALRLTYNRAILERDKLASDIVVASPPEALTLTQPALCGGAAATVLYPDPPLGREELEILAQLRPDCSFVTPLSRLARAPRPAHISRVAVSISESEDVARYGLSEAHFATLTDEIHLYLLLAGLKIVYGGALKGRMPAASNFALRLFALVRSYSKLAENVSAPSLRGAVMNVAPWPLRLEYGDEEWGLFDDASGAVAEYQEGPCPEELAGRVDEIFGAPGPAFTLDPDTPLRRYAWARGQTLMREKVTDLADARLVIGGKLENFSGIIPGVVEETCLSLRRGRPLFLIGGFGGAARAVCDQLRGRARPEFTDAFSARTVRDYAACKDLFAANNVGFESMQDIGAMLTARASAPLSKTMNNGLDDRDNLELMQCRDAQRVFELVLQGTAAL